MKDQIKLQSSAPMSGFQVLMVALCFFMNFNDGIDVLIVSFSSSEIIREFGLSKTEMGYIFSTGLAGMTLGCFSLAPLADKYGRRKIFLISLLMISLGMFGVAFAQAYVPILAWRFLTGLGIGGILPTIATTAAEYSNDKYRDFNVGLIQAGWPIGAILTGLICADLIPLKGWHYAFFLAGCFSAMMTVLVFFVMKDSEEFQSKKIEEQGVKVLLTEELKPNTWRLWLAAFFGFMTLYTVMSWVPTIAKDSGMPFELATYVGISLNIGAAIGSSSIGALGSKFGLKKTHFIYMLSAFTVMQLYAFLPLNTVLIFILVMFIGVFAQGGFNGIWPILSRIYPTSIRATGVGYTVGIGRLGAILGPAVFGILSDSHVGNTVLFVLFSLPLLVMGLIIRTLPSQKL
ncbi:MFS transporter [Aquirufa nivalisilvae]|uniref:MFS transporter n=1 Tax=Aquirufa nivalisilvae TaxID=2516557 RepID=UPI0022A95731|nr:MFS transporter [Aquirufa nivalisilvae]MCZ2482538.1 MFS transporter [Aquirufa nivalisilvae]